VSAAVVYNANAPTFRIEHGNVLVDYHDDLPERCYPLAQFRIATARAVRCLAEHDARGQVIKMRKR
jgi:hypothetical protein